MRAEEGNPAGLSSCSGGLRPLVELCVHSDPALGDVVLHQKPQLKPTGSVAEEEDPKPSHQLYKLQIKPKGYRAITGSPR